MKNFADIINAFPTAQQMADELGMEGDNASVTVRQWRNRDSIPSDWWPQIIDLAKANGIDGVDYPKLIQMRLNSKKIRAKARQGAEA